MNIDRGALYHEVRARLHELYPAAFCGRGEIPVPLKVGIHRDLSGNREHGFTPRRIRAFLATWCGRREYLTAITAGGPRRALDGSEAGAVTPEQQAIAAALLAEIAARKAAA